MYSTRNISVRDRAGFQVLTAIRLVFFAITFLASPALASEPLIGRASVIDGDTIEIHGERIRLNGIDAPEGRQRCQDARGKDYRCGTIAANALADFLSASSPTRCEFIERDRYRRFVGRCFRADGKDVQAWLVRNGHALDWPRYSKGAYASDQEDAKRNRRGMWSGSFMPPWEWRRNRGS